MKVTTRFLFTLLCLCTMQSWMAAQNGGHQVWQIGELNQSAEEFSLYRGDYTQFRTLYPENSIVYEIGKNKPADIPYFLPGPQDAWAGGKKTQLLVRFGIAQVDGSVPATLRLDFVETHPSGTPRLFIDMNGYQQQIRLPSGANQDYFRNKQTTSSGLSVEIEIPAGTLKKGENLLTIRNDRGSWLAWDRLALYASKPLTTESTPASISLAGSDVLPALLWGKNDQLFQPGQLWVYNWGNKPRTVEVRTGDQPVQKVSLQKGMNTVEVLLPETTVEKPVPVTITSGKEKVAETTLLATPVNKWSVYLVQHTHTDIGYTKPQTEILTEHLRYIDYALEYCEMTENYPDDAKFRWNCEAAWAVHEYIKCRPAEQIAKLKKYIEKGQIEVTAMYFNMSEIVDENSLKTFLEPIRAFKEQGIPVKTGMQNDVNGIAWALADYLPDLGIRYMAIGEHGHRALIPFDMPTVFRWESPSGKPLYTYRADHYMTGNFWGIERGDIDVMTPGLFSYLRNLEQKNYPYDAVAVQYSGYYTDNSPPSTIVNGLIAEWNKKYAYPRLRSALVSEFMDYVTEKYDDSQIPVYRVGYPDWWTDGFGSAARETGASRKTHSDMITVEGMLSMATMKGKQLPSDTKDKITHIHKSLLFYDEHTFGASESISDPMCENSQVQWAEKSAFVWEGLKSAQMLYETSAGLLQNDLARGENPTITFFNTLGWKRSALANVYIDFEVIPRNVPFRLIDQQGKELKYQPISSRDEGVYYAIYAENIPAMGYKTFEIVIDKKVEQVRAERQINRRSMLQLQEPRTHIENNYYSLRVDEKTGAIESLFDKELNLEMVDADSPWKLGAFVYEKLGNRNQMERYTLTDYERNGLYDAKITGYLDGPVYQTIHVEGKSDCCQEGFGVRMEIRLFHDTKRIELNYAVKRLPITDPTGIYVAFPFQLDKGELSFDVQGGVITSGVNQLTGTASDWNTVQNFVTARNGKAQFIVGSDLVPLFEMGGITTGLYQYQKSYDVPHVYSFVMNNYWTTNFRAFQEGEFRWSYYLTSANDVSDAHATQFGWASRVPLYARVMPEGKPNNQPMEYSAFRVDSDHILMTSATPASREGYVLINVRELNGEKGSLQLLNAEGKSLSFIPVNAIEESMGNEVKELLLQPYENRFILVRK